MDILKVDMAGRFTFWNEKVEKARADEKIELSLLYEAVREYVRTQRSICVRMDTAVDKKESTKNNFSDTIFSSEDDSVFGMEMHLCVNEGDEEGSTDDVKFASIMVEKIDGQTIPEANIIPPDFMAEIAKGAENNEPLKDMLSASSAIRNTLVAVLRGFDRLAFAYTPFVMMITRLTVLDLENIHVESDPGQLEWSMTTTTDDRLITVNLHFGEMVKYFNM